MIKQAPVTGRNAIKVSFVLPQDAIPGNTSVVGDFNGWDPLAHPLRPRANGTRSAAVTLPPGRRFAFRYLAEGGRWHDDETAEAFEPNGAGGHNAVLHTYKQAPSRSTSRLDIFRGAQSLGRRSDPEQPPGPGGGHGRPTSARGLGC